MFQTNTISRPAFDPILLHEPVSLRRLTPGDYAAWAQLRGDSRTHLTAWEQEWSADDLSRSAFRRRLRFYERQARASTGLSLAIFSSDETAMVGGLSLTNIRFGAVRSGVLGYWIGAPFTKKGYGRAAVEAILRHSFHTLDLNRVEAACQPENAASKKLLERCGFAREGLARDYLRINGRWLDHEIFAITARQYSDGQRDT